VGRELRFKPNMVFNLAVGFQDVPLTSADTSKAKGAIKSVKQFSMLLADTVKISESGFPEVLTKASTAWNDVSYTIKEDDGDDDDEEDDEEEDEAEGEDEGVTVKTAAGKATVLKSRLRERTTVSDAQMENKAKRADKQARLHAKAQERGLEKFTGGGNGSASSGGGYGDGSGEAAEDFESFKSSSEYPYEAKGSAVHVDMEREVLFLPLGGVPVPFHISTVKNVVMPEPEAKAALLKLNFYTPGQVYI
jgi:nucleosome binding factor SPN SPT16 subunit